MVVVVSQGSCPAFDVFRRVLEGEEVVVDKGLIEALDSARRSLELEASRRNVYGFCTGLGALAGHKGSCGPQWEHRVLVEHALGVGDYMRVEVSKLFLFTRLLQMSKGHDPVRSVLALRIADAVNSGIIPLIPVRGSLGASGDLVPSAHAFLCIMEGYGHAFYKGSVVDCSKALEAEGLKPLELEPGEALALINNTAWSTAILAYSIMKLEDLMDEAFRTAKESLEVCRCNREHYESHLSKLKEHQGIGRALNALNNPECSGSSRLQDPYSLRCTPFIYGAILDVLDYAKTVTLKEACSTTTNPAVVEGKVSHSCAFHGVYVAITADMLAIAVAHIANTIERRIAQIMRSEITNLPEFLAREGPVGEMIRHYVAASITARIRALATPYSIHSLPVSGLQEDIIPQAGEATLRLLEITELLRQLMNKEEEVVTIAKTLQH